MSESEPEPPIFSSHAEWLLSHAPVQVLEHQSLSEAVHITRISGDGFNPDPSTPDVTVQFAMAGTCHFSRLDMGHGQFSGSCRPGDFLVTAPDEPCLGDAEGQYKSLIVGIPWAAMRSHLQDVTGRDAPHLGRLHKGFHRDETVSMLVGALGSEMASGGVMGTLFADGVTHALVARLLYLSKIPLPEVVSRTGGLGKVDLERVIDYLHDNLREDVSLTALARVICVSPNHFGAMFKQSTGVSPHQYVIRERVEQAKSLLFRCPELSVAQVAAQVGFADQSHLSRHMKRLLGITPGRITGRVHYEKE